MNGHNFHESLWNILVFVAVHNWSLGSLPSKVMRLNNLNLGEDLQNILVIISITSWTLDSLPSKIDEIEWINFLTAYEIYYSLWQLKDEA